MKNIVAAILAVACLAYAPVAFASEYPSGYVWCYVKVGQPPAQTWYYSGATYAMDYQSNALENNFLAHVRARYGGNATGSECRKAKSGSEAIRDRDSHLARMADIGTAAVNTKWTWDGPYRKTAHKYKGASE